MEIKLLPFQGVFTSITPPRALPWATGLLAFQAAVAQYFHYLQNLNLKISKVYFWSQILLLGLSRSCILGLMVPLAMPR